MTTNASTWVYLMDHTLYKPHALVIYGLCREIVHRQPYTFMKLVGGNIEYIHIHLTHCYSLVVRLFR